MVAPAPFGSSAGTDEALRCDPAAAGMTLELEKGFEGRRTGEGPIGFIVFA
jgi:hypothetical protein